MLFSWWLSAVLVSCHVYLDAGFVIAKWNGTGVLEGHRLRVPVRTTSSGKIEIKQDFACYALNTFYKVEFVCNGKNGLEGSVDSKSQSVTFNFEAVFTLTTTNVDEWITCECRAISFFLRESLSFFLSSKANTDVTWNGMTVPDGSTLRVPVRATTNGEKEIIEKFSCSVPIPVWSLEFSCQPSDDTYSSSTNISFSSNSIFPFTTSLVDNLWYCTCTANYSNYAVLMVKSSSFLLSSKADFQKGIVEMSVTLLASISTTALVAQVIGHRSWV